MIFTKKLTGTEICLLLFDQNVLEYNEEDISSLRRGRVSAYDFMLEKIRNVEITPAQLALEPCSGSVVQTDAKTGDIMAIVTYPSYDNNMLANRIDWPYYSSLLEDKSNPLYNRATQQRTTTGSSIKIMTAVAGLSQSTKKFMMRLHLQRLCHRQAAGLPEATGIRIFLMQLQIPVTTFSLK